MSKRIINTPLRFTASSTNNAITQVRRYSAIVTSRITHLALFITLLLTFTFLQAQTPAQSYDYDYIAALYDKQEDNAALVEIDSFLVRYPDSIYRIYLRFMQAEIHYFKMDFSTAVPIYAELIQSDLELQTRADVYLHYATALYYMGNHSLALTILERLESEIDIGQYHQQATIWQARAYAAQGQINSAIYYYAIARGYFPGDGELRYEYFMLLLSDDKDEEALKLVTESIADIEPLYVQTMLDHYLEKGLYPEFDKLVQTYNYNADNPDANLRLILAKAAFLKTDYEKSRQILATIEFHNPKTKFLDAILLSNDGKNTEADSIFAELVQSKDPDIAHKSWLERLKLLFRTSPEDAISQLDQYILNNPTASYQSQRYYLSAFFDFLQEDYIPALKNLNKALASSQTRQQTEQAEVLSIECWYKLGRFTEAIEICERLINHSPRSVYIDRALYCSALIAFESKDYTKAREHFQLLETSCADSPLALEALFYLGEIEFFHANYNLALERYHRLMIEHGSSQLLVLRAAQTRYFIKDYPAARAWLDSIPDYGHDSDYYLLSGSINFNERKYEDALIEYEQALTSATSELNKAEISSYKALTLYQLKRFVEASQIYISLSSMPESPDIYHYLAAKSAYQTGNFMQALDLYDSFLDVFPDSDYTLSVISEIATANYNLGKFQESLDDRISILQRFKSRIGFEEQELSLIRESIAGIELCLNRIDDLDSALRFADMIESFSSDYIKFELQYMLLKVYAEQDVWNGLLDTATQLRQAFPDNKRSDIELLMAEALIRLNRPAEADSLLSSFYSNDPVILIKWGDLDQLSGKQASALARYRQAWELAPTSELWVKLLSTSKDMAWQDFDSLLVLGTALIIVPPEASALSMNYYYAVGNLSSAGAIADSLLTQNINPWYHASAYLQKALILYTNADFSAAINALSRLKLIFGDYTDVRIQANYHHIMALLKTGAKTEAEILLEQTGKELSPEQIREIDLEFRATP